MVDDISELLFNGMNEQGYLFQEACAQVLLKNVMKMGWEKPVLEYSTSLRNGESTRADIVLNRPDQGGLDVYANIECKRAHPDYSLWLFGAPVPEAEPCQHLRSNAVVFAERENPACEGFAASLHVCHRGPVVVQDGFVGDGDARHRAANRNGRLGQLAEGEQPPGLSHLEDHRHGSRLRVQDRSHRQESGRVENLV